MATLSFTTRTGEISVLVFPKVLSECSYMLQLDGAVMLKCTISLRDDEDAELILKQAVPLIPNGKYVPRSIKNTENTANAISVPRANTSKEKQAQVPKKLYLKIDSIGSRLHSRAEAIVDIFGGETEVVYFSEAEKRYYKRSGSGLALNEFTLGELTELLGKSNVVLK